MARLTFPALAALFFGGCTDIERHEVNQDYIEIVEAVLRAQPDVAEQRRNFISEYPDERGVLDRILDYRLCVSHQTAGQPGDFERSNLELRGAPPDFDVYGKRWEESKTRQFIPDRLLPNHLRWDAFLSFCPSGVLRIGNPEILGTRAKVYLENASTFQGWAGEINLAKVHGKWVVHSVWNWRQS